MCTTFGEIGGEVKVLLSAMALVLATCLLGCTHAGGQATTNGPVLRIAVSLDGITANDDPISLSQLDPRLDELKDVGGSVWFSDQSTSGGTYARWTYPYTEKQKAKWIALEQQVVAMVDEHDLSMLFSDMPTTGWASPGAVSHTDP